jgi:hypothetical protein
MKFFLGYIFFYLHVSLTFAESRSILKDNYDNGLDNQKLREGSMKFEDIPGVLLAVTNNLLSFVAYLSLFVIIVGGLMYILGGVQEEIKSKGKQAVQVALIGAVVSWAWWIIVNFVFDNF